MEVAVVSDPKTPSSADLYIPDRSYDLIDRLAEIYVARCILPNETPEEAHRYAGAVDLVNQLIEWKANELGVETPLARPLHGGRSKQLELPMQGVDD